MSLLSKLFGRNQSVEPEPRAPAEEPLVIVPIPPLVDLLAHHEKEKGAPLTESEVLQISGNAVCMTMSQSRAAAMAQARGYDDIDPSRAWDEWNALQSQR